VNADIAQQEEIDGHLDIDVLDPRSATRITTITLAMSMSTGTIVIAITSVTKDTIAIVRDQKTASIQEMIADDFN